MKIAICSGSFDPITLGHMDIICRAAQCFDEVWVCVSPNAEKKNQMFTPEEKLALVQAADYLQCAGELSDATRQLYADIRGIVPRFADDTPKHREIAAIENFLKNNSASL